MSKIFSVTNDRSTSLLTFPQNNVYVYSQADFGTTTIINGETYRVLSGNTQYLIVNNFAWTEGLFINVGLSSRVSIRALNKNGTLLQWNGFTTEPVIVLQTGLVDFTNIRIEDISGTNEYFFEGSSGVLDILNTTIASFNNTLLFNITQGSITNSRLLGGSGRALDMIDVNSFFARDSQIGGTSANEIIKISGAGTLRPSFSGNSLSNNVGSVFNIDVTVSFPLAMICINNNANLFGTSFFEPGSIDETQPGVEVLMNPNVKNSQALAGASDFSGTVVTQTISVVSTPVILEGLPVISDPLTERFTYSQSGVPIIWKYTYDGEPRTFILTCSAFLVPVSAPLPIISLGFFINGSPLLNSFQPISSSETESFSSRVFSSLTTGDEIQIGVQNNTDIINIDVSNPRIGIAETA